MSRQIPMDRPLLLEDRKYLEDRGQYAMVARLDQNYPQTDASELPKPEGSDHPGVQLLVEENRSLAEQLAAAQRELAELRNDPSVAVKPAAEEGDDGAPYSEWTKEELQSEAEARGLVKSGSKAELVARLEEYDSTQA